MLCHCTLCGKDLHRITLFKLYYVMRVAVLCSRHLASGVQPCLCIWEGRGLRLAYGLLDIPLIRMVLCDWLVPGARDMELAKFEAFLKQHETLDISALVRGSQRLAYPIKGCAFRLSRVSWGVLATTACLIESCVASRQRPASPMAECEYMLVLAQKLLCGTGSCCGKPAH